MLQCFCNSSKSFLLTQLSENVFQVCSSRRIMATVTRQSKTLRTRLSGFCLNLTSPNRTLQPREARSRARMTRALSTPALEALPATPSQRVEWAELQVEGRRRRAKNDALTLLPPPKRKEGEGGMAKLSSAFVCMNCGQTHGAGTSHSFLGCPNKKRIGG